MTFGFQRSHRVLHSKFARHLHLKYRFAWVAAEKDNLSSMFDCYAVSECKTKASPFLLPFAHEWLEETTADVFWNSRTIVDDA